MTRATTHPASEELMVFLDGEACQDAASIAAHLESCTECQSIAGDLRRTSTALASWEVQRPSAAMGERVLAAAKRQPAPAGGALRIMRRWTWKGWALAGAGAAFGLLLVIALTNPMAERGTSSPAALARGQATRAVKQIPEGEGRATDGALAQKGHYQGWLEPAKPSDSLSMSRGAPRAMGGGGGDTNGTLGRLEEQARDAFSVNGQTAADETKSLAAIPEHLIAGQPMIARTANLRVVVARFETARGSLDAILMRYQAYAAWLEVSTTEGAARRITASLRVPSAQLGAAMADLKALGRVENESQAGEEVTEQHADLVARLKNARETETRLDDILRTRTGKVKDVLEVEQEMSRVRCEIEEMDAQQKNLEHRVDFATLNLTIAEEYKAKLESNAPSLGMRLRNSIVLGFRNAFGSFFSLILFVAEAAPVLLTWLVILSPLGWFAWRRFRAVRAALT